MISLDAISKRFGRRQALEGVSLHVPRGVVYGLLGHNGAGKSTLIGTLLGHVVPDAGKASIGGRDVWRDRGAALAKVGAIFEGPAFYDYLSGEKNLRIFCEYSAPIDEANIREVTRLVGLERRIKDRVGTYSHGMRQRLALAQALIPRPELLILDEPSEGLDPEGIHEIRNLVARLNREWGLTVFFSSHVLGEVQQLCSHVAVLRGGRLLFAGPWQAASTVHAVFRMRVDREIEAEAALVAAGIVTGFDANGQGRLARGRTVPDVGRWLASNGFAIEHLSSIETDLEDFYLDLVRRGADAATDGA